MTVRNLSYSTYSLLTMGRSWYVQVHTRLYRTPRMPSGRSALISISYISPSQTVFHLEQSKATSLFLNVLRRVIRTALTRRSAQLSFRLRKRCPRGSMWILSKRFRPRRLRICLFPVQCMMVGRICSQRVSCRLAEHRR